MRVALDTSVLVAAFRSRHGASLRVLSLVGTERVEIAVSVPLVLEYEDALLRQLGVGGLTRDDVEAVVDYVCRVALRQPIFFLWRPCLPDPGDDMVLEVAVAAGCDAIVTFNVRDFAGAEVFGIRVLTPQQLLEELP